MFILKTLIITSMLFSFSIRNSKDSNISDYEFSIGGENKQFSIEIEKERQNNKYYDYQSIKYIYKLNNINIDIYYLNNQEDKLNILDLGVSKNLFNIISLGIGEIRLNHGYFKPKAYLKYKYRDCFGYDYSLYKNGYMHNLELKYKYNINTKLCLVPKFKIVKTNYSNSYQGKLIFEYKLK